MSREVLLQILDLARWAPSGDNTQPWRFEVLADDRLAVHGSDTRDHCVYDFDGRPSQMAVGALIESISIAATRHNLAALASLREGSLERQPIFDVRFVPDANAVPHPLADFLRERSVQRRPLSTRPLSASEKDGLRVAAGTDFEILWLEGSANRRKVAGLLWKSARLRLTIPEAYAVHREIIAWQSRYSEDRVPDQAIGLDPIGLRLMRWVMQSWDRVEFFNTYLGGTLLPRLQLDLVPGLRCAAHFAIAPARAPKSVGDYVEAGRAMQRLWLTATQLGLQMQPEMTPLIFSAYTRAGTAFSKKAEAAEQARSIEQSFSALLGSDTAKRATFFGRIGHGAPPVARSTRLPLARLLINQPGKVESGTL